jgi:hypothetical protein
VVVDQSQSVQTSDLGGVQKRSSLSVGEPTGDGDNDVRDELVELGSGGIPQLGEVHRYELGSGEFGGLAEVLDLDTDCAVDIDKFSVDELLFDFLDLLREYPRSAPKLLQS